MPQQGQAQGQESPLGQMLDKLSDLMRKQQKLMDETQRMPQQGMGEETSRMASSRARTGQQGMGSLGDRQQGLSQMLEDLMKQFGENGMQAPPLLRAGRQEHEAVPKARCARATASRRWASRARPCRSCAKAPRAWPSS